MKIKQELLIAGAVILLVVIMICTAYSSAHPVENPASHEVQHGVRVMVWKAIAHYTENDVFIAAACQDVHGEFVNKKEIPLERRWIREDIPAVLTNVIQFTPGPTCSPEVIKRVIRNQRNK